MAGAAFDADAFNAFEAEGWNSVAPAYHGFFGQVTARCADRLLAAAGVGPGTRVLDVATGPGYVAGRAAARGAQAVGLDVAPGMVALAARLHPEAEFLTGDAERLPFADGSFDALVAGFCLLHLARPEEALADWVRVLRPGGRLAATMWDLPERNRLLGLLLEAMADCGVAPPADVPAGPPLLRFSAESELRRALEAAGLEQVAVESLRFSHRLEGPQPFWRGLVEGTVRIRSLIVGLSDESRAKLRACFERHCAAYAADGRLQVPVATLVASGQRPG